MLRERSGRARCPPRPTDEREYRGTSERVHAPSAGIYIIAFLAASFAIARSSTAFLACDLTPMMPPPHVRSICFAFSLYCWRIDVTSWLNSWRSSGRTETSATAVAVFLCTRAPNLDLLLTMQYGMSIL